MAAGWRKTAATVLLVVGFLARACPVSAGFEKAKSCPDATKPQMDFSAVQRAWLQTGSLSVTLLDGKDGCLLEKDALFKTRVNGRRLVVRKETKPKMKVCEVAVTQVPAPGNQLFVSCIVDKPAASEELKALMGAVDATLQSRRIGRTMGGFTPTPPKSSPGLPRATEQDEGALTTSEVELPPTSSPTEPKITKKYASTETVLSTVKIIPTPTVLSTEIKVTHLSTLMATVTVPPLSTVVKSITLTPTTERKTVTTPPPTTNAPSTPLPLTSTKAASTPPPPTATEEAATPPPPTTTEEPPTTQPPTTSERPTEHPLTASSEASKPAVTALATAKSPLLEEDAERFGAKSGTLPNPEPTHEKSKDWTELLGGNLPYVIGGAAGVLVLILLIIVLVAVSKRRRKVSREDPIVLGNVNYRRQQDDLDKHDQDHVNIMMYSADEPEEEPHQTDLEERILKPPGGASSTPATPRCLRDKNFD